MDKLIYASRETRPMSDADLVAILEVARERNALLDVTGMLVYEDGTFLQVLEGEASALDEIWDSLVRDDRHYALHLISRKRIRERRFHAWAMGFSRPEEAMGEGPLPGHAPLDTVSIVGQRPSPGVAEAMLELLSELVSS